MSPEELIIREAIFSIEKLEPCPILTDVVTLLTAAKEKLADYIDFKNAFEPYWPNLKHSVDENGWVYSKEVTHILDFYFEQNTGKKIQFEKSYDGPWRGSRWRPVEIAKIKP